jgi:TPR repeat protein
MYGNGRGVLQDNVRAHMWYNIGAANGNALGGENRGKLADEMTSADISQAQAMARECMSSGYTDCGW